MVMIYFVRWGRRFRSKVRNKVFLRKWGVINDIKKPKNDVFIPLNIVWLFQTFRYLSIR